MNSDAVTGFLYNVTYIYIYDYDGNDYPIILTKKYYYYFLYLNITLTFLFDYNRSVLQNNPSSQMFTDLEMYHRPPPVKILTR